jgi:nitric oxide synthase-interacting protein
LHLIFPLFSPFLRPSGHLYEREVILEYLLTKTRELKLQAQAYEEEQVRLAAEAERKSQEEVAREMTKFAESEDGVDRIVKRKSTAVEEQHSFLASRKRVIDDTDRETQMKQLKEINPWLPQFTPHAEETRLKKPPKRPSSPMTSRPLRVSDLIPINMHREIPAEQGGTSSETTVKFICPVSRFVTSTSSFTVAKISFAS